MAESYPNTANTWIAGELALGAIGRESVWRHIMNVYSAPLRVYGKRAYARFHDVDDLVNGFFASRLEDDAYLAAWHASGRRLRDWLRSGLDLYEYGCRRKYSIQNGRTAPLAETDADVPDASEDPMAAFERQLILSIVQEARRSAAETCRAVGLAEHWRVFERHVVEGEAYETICAELQIDANRAARMNATAKSRFVTALRDVVRKDGVPESDIDRTIAEFLATFD